MGECSETKLEEEGCFYWQEKLQSIRPSGTLTTQLSKKWKEGILWALPGSTGSWGIQWKSGPGVLGERGLCPPKVSQGGEGVSCLSASTLIRAGKGAVEGC